MRDRLLSHWCGVELAERSAEVEDEEHVGFGSRGFVLHGKKPEIQLCVQADAGSGSWLKPSLRPARLNTSLDLFGSVWR